MKKILLVLALLMPMCMNAQEKEERINSKTLEFLAKDGSAYKKEFYDLATVGKAYSPIQNQVLIATNMVTGVKMGCLRIITIYDGSKYIGTLDSDELDSAIASMEKFHSEIKPTLPEIYTELEYRTRDGVNIGMYSDKKEWKIYVQTKSYTTRSLSTFTSEDLEKYINILKEAKRIIADKVR